MERVGGREGGRESGEGGAALGLVEVFSASKVGVPTDTRV